MWLVKGWADLEGLEILESDVLRDEEIEPLRKQLLALAREECSRCPTQTEQENVRAAQAQVVLSTAVALSLLRARGRFAKGDTLFWPVQEEVVPVRGQAADHRR